MKQEYIGIDPGPRYTAISVICGEEILHSSTYKRPEEMKPITWAIHVTDLIQEEILVLYPNAKIGIEGVVTPGAYKDGKKSLISPKYLIHLSFVVGALAQHRPDAVIVRPGKNGSGTNYPAELQGRRPKTLPGHVAGTRKHERSAYDVAKQIEQHIREGYTLDTIRGMFDD